jgi:putative ABC transport system permease protein
MKAMWIMLRLAIRNLTGAGLRTWVNVLVLSFSFVVIIWLKGVMAGWDHQARRDMTEWEIGYGQLWHNDYDPYDPFSAGDSHALTPPDLDFPIQAGKVSPVLMVNGTLYPRGRMQPLLIIGIEPGQKVLKIPTGQLKTQSDGIPALVGRLAANGMNIEKGDRITLRWRTASGMFDAEEIVITEIFDCNVPSVTSGKIYIPIDQLRTMMQIGNEATIFTFGEEVPLPVAPAGWTTKTQEELTSQVDRIIKTKSAGQSVFYFILLLLAMLAIFDTQVLSIFRRQKEIGTYVALGYTRRQVVGLFTIEGAMHALMAAVLAAMYGFPFLAWQAVNGWTMPVEVSEYGMAIAQTLYPVYSTGLILSTIIIILLVTTFVSYLPSRKIARMNPTEALRGRLQ